MEMNSVNWHSRGYLPHYDSMELYQSITFRLADSLPQRILKNLEEDLKILGVDKLDYQRRNLIDKYLDMGCGCCALKNQQMAKVMKESLIRFDNERYQLIAWCIMPNHVHALLKPKIGLAKIIQSWRSYTGRWAFRNNAKYELGITADSKRFWMRDYWDRYIRSEKHFYSVLDYIHENPVKAGLCKAPENWKWSSAFEE
ncbi:transposase [Lentisphaera profundi]|uniref:Transposase n=1 Tax=Lentisphaera profundi TaxID=1658616 RepID=A0ABY7VRZ2_9BACT|nr:transposase [Lentisphaera profundi]WDE96487.1 transposase [Lentisphaera profundi]